MNRQLVMATIYPHDNLFALALPSCKSLQQPSATTVSGNEFKGDSGFLWIVLTLYIYQPALGSEYSRGDRAQERSQEI